MRVSVPVANAAAYAGVAGSGIDGHVLLRAAWQARLVAGEDAAVLLFEAHHDYVVCAMAAARIVPGVIIPAARARAIASEKEIVGA